MHAESFREYCLAKKAVTEGFPFDEHTLVFKVMGKMFALVSLEKTPCRVNLKCDPERAIELRDEYDTILPGYHMNKQLWNTVIIEGGRPDDNLIRELTDHSYDLVVASLPAKLRRQLEDL